MLLYKQIRVIFAVLSAAIFFFNSYSAEISAQKNHSQMYLRKGVPVYNQKVEFSDTVLPGILSKYNELILKNDTIQAVLHLIEASDIERFSGNYEEAFELLWNGAGIIKQHTDNPLNIRINRNLGILYDIYNKDALTEYHLFESLKQAKYFAANNIVDSVEILHCYFSLATYCRGNSNFSTALQYLDSCQGLYPNNEFLPYVEADKGFLYLKLGDINNSAYHLYKVKNYFITTKSRYWAVVASFIGDLKMELHETDSAIFYYNLSIEAIDKYKVHLEYKPILLEKLAKLHFQKGDYAFAYQTLSMAKQNMDTLFNITYRRNSKLFEIKNIYQEKLEKNNKLLQQQSQTITDKDRLLKVLVISLLSIALFGILIAFIIRQKLKINKLNAGKLFEKEKTEAILNMKSKELSTYALQMVEKEQSVQELLSILKESNSPKYNKLEKKYLSQSNKLWDNFNKRFLEVNNDFYIKLIAKHPELTPTEQKHCALIRMKFDNNELTQILNISLQAVHTSRYRIRKKIGLERDDNLDDYIAGV